MARGDRGSVRPSDDDARAAAHALVALVRRDLPQRFYKEPRWRMLAAAMVARMADTVESTIALWEGTHALDMTILLRALYEQVVVFAWLAIEPVSHIEQWSDNERYYRRVLVEQAAEYGIPCTEQELEERGKKLKPIDQLASAVDAHWGGRVAGFRAPAAKGQRDETDLLNFAGLYLPHLPRGERCSARPARVAAPLRRR